MASNNRGGNRGGNRRGGQNNNPEGHNQYSSSIFGAARDNPLTTAAAVGGAVAAGVFLWSRRNQSAIRSATSPTRSANGARPVRQRFDADERHRRPSFIASSRRPRRPEEPGAVLRGSADAQGNRKDDRLTVTPDDDQGRLGRPFSCGQEIRDRSPNSGLVTELMCVPGTSAKRIGKDVRELLRRAVVVVLFPQTTSVGIVNACEPAHERVLEALEELARRRLDRPAGSS